MPTYAYKCSSCGEFDVVKPLADYDKPAICPYCGTVTDRQVFYSPMLKFGTGMPEYERRIMKSRYEERNRRLDLLPEDQKKRMKEFMNSYGVRKDPPSDLPPKANSRGA